MADSVRVVLQAAKSQAAILSDFYLRTNLSKPHVVLIEPTLRCPMACKFCDLPNDRTYPKSDEMSMERWKEVLCELRDFSPLARSVYISGGEPFLRRDLIDLIEYAHGIGMGTRTLTIGQFCTPALLDRILASPMDFLKFSLHSSRREVHNGLVGRDVYDRAVDAIRYLRGHGYTGRLGMLCTVFQGNVDHLGEVARFGADLGLDYIYFRPLFGQTVADRTRDAIPAEPDYHPDCVVQDLGQLARAIEELKSLKRDGLPIADTDQQLDAIIGQAEGTFEGVRGCHFMYECIYIKPNGNIDACGHLALGVLGNVKDHSVAEVLGSREAYDVRHAVTRKCMCTGNIFVNMSKQQKVRALLELLRD
jgi:MoaA/NifB/PqqE/SkfB family radical SAM enzyme